jgi:hypothetical protein
MEKLVIVDGESYKDWITEISNEFKRSQIRAAVKINDEMLRFYWKRYFNHEQAIRIWIRIL